MNSRNKAAIILWSSFWVGGIMTTAFYCVFDPMEMTLHGARLFDSPIAAYTVSFFLAWAFSAFAAATALFFAREKEEVNRFCPVDDSRWKNPPDSQPLSDL